MIEKIPSTIPTKDLNKMLEEFFTKLLSNEDGESDSSQKLVQCRAAPQQDDLYYKALKLLKFKKRYRKYSKINFDRLRESRLTGMVMQRVTKLIDGNNKRGFWSWRERRIEFDAQKYYKKKII